MIERTVGIVEKAKPADAEAIQGIVNYFADQGEMLHRELSDIRGNIGDFFVYRQGDIVEGCVALHVLEEGLGEIRAMAVIKRRHGQGIGRLLVQACLDKAAAEGVPNVFLLTYKPKIFESYGFKRTLIIPPAKLYGECETCPNSPPENCGEIAMVLSNL